MVAIRIQELAQAKGFTLAEIGEASGIPAEAMEKYQESSIEITEETASELRKIAETLDESLMELLKPVAKRGAFKLKIRELAEEKGLTLKEISEKAKVHPAIVAFYSTQVICKDKLSESSYKKYLDDISKVLEVSPKELKVAAELPATNIRVREIAEEMGLTLERLSLLAGLPQDLVELADEQPVEFIDNFKDVDDTLGNPFDLLCCPKRSCCKKNALEQ